MTAVFMISANQLNQLMGAPECPVIVDVRRREAFNLSGRMIATAEWRDHQQAGQWAAGLPGGAVVVVYCVHGHEVSQGAAETLRSVGVDARFLEGGIEGFVKAGGETVVK